MRAVSITVAAYEYSFPANVRHSTVREQAVALIDAEGAAVQKT